MVKMAILRVLFVAVVGTHAVQFRKNAGATGSEKNSEHGVDSSRKLLSRRGDKPPSILLNHLAKCGGTSAKALLAAAVGGIDVNNETQWEDLAVHNDLLDIETEGRELDKEDVSSPHHYIIGTIRNPYDFYVSFWSFTSSGWKGANYAKILTPEQQEEMLSGIPEKPGSTPEDRAKFKKWLYYITSEELGLFSLRFYGSYLNPGKELRDFHWRHGENDGGVNNHWPKDTSTSFLSEHGNNTAEVVSALEDLDLEENCPVDCWLHTETLDVSTAKCLQQWEKYEGGAGYVNWEAFRHTITNHKKVQTEHVECDLFYDADLKDLVNKGDRHLFRAFGYEHGCSRPH